VLDYSRSGVGIFFVISGFVIGHTTRDLGPRLRDGLRFSLRRQVRLDAPYYAVMLAVVVLSLGERLVPGLVYQTHSPRQFIVDMFYLQDITHTDAVLAVAWTLCLEVQSYLVVVVLVLLAGRLARTQSARQRLVRIGAIGLGALSLAFPLLNLDGGPWFIGLWWMFCLGLTLSWFMHGRLSRSATLGVLGVVGLWCAISPVVGTRPDPWSGQWFAWATAVLILILIRSGRISAPVPRVLLYFGTISYSLYLVHLPVIDTLLGALFKLTDESPAGAVLGFVIGAVVSIVVAHLLNQTVEQWAIRLSKRIRVGRFQDEPALPASGPDSALPPDPKPAESNR
jgi:peptidoglycan/LPS O-acetylase OafA/YrhL